MKYNVGNIFLAFAQIAHAHPKKIAVVSDRGFHSYADLLRYSELIAASLQDKVTPGEHIGVIYSRRHELIAVILAILRVGGVYVPIDPRYPPERIKYIVDDAKINKIICRPKFKYLVPQSVSSITFDELIYQDTTANTPLKYNLSPDGNETAYVIYTSGTTGAPKGVMIAHNCVITLLNSAYVQGIKYTHHDSWTMFHSYAFDFSIWEIFGAILTGGTLHILDDEIIKSAGSLYEYLIENKITILSLTPSVFKQLLKVIDPQRLLKLRYIVFGGERFDLSDYKKWLELLPQSKTKLVNMYGITETTVHTTIYFLSQVDLENYESNQSPIGIALKHFEIFLLDQNLNQVEDDEVGEIYVAGLALAKGYLNKPELTQEKFIQIPSGLNSKYKIMYKSGDLAKKIGKSFVYQGRSDNQVKFRGYRIELDEIEKALLKIPKIKQAVVLIDKSSEFQVLVGIYSADNLLDEALIRAKLDQVLPSYAIPDKFFHMKEIPVNINGKVNKVLAKQEYESHKIDQSIEPIDLENSDQVKLLKCWHKVLGENLAITKYSNFFKLGGYSLLTFSLLSEINKAFNVSAKIGFINQYPCFIELLEQIKKLQTDLPSNKIATNLTGNDTSIIAASYNQLALYYTCAIKGSNAYNICYEIKFNENLSFDKCRQSLFRIINRHSELRISFTYEEGKLSQITLPPVQMEHILQSLNPKPKDKENLLIELANYQFKLDNDYLFKFYYIQTDNDETLVINIHHTIFDGSSLNLFISELLQELNDHEGQKSKLSYYDFVSYQNSLLNDATYVKLAKDHWGEILTDDAVTKLKFSDVKAYRAAQSSNHLNTKISDSLVEKIDNVCAKLNISPYILYLFAYGFMLNNYTSETKFAIGVPYANRPIEFLETYGYFINTLPVVFDFKDHGHKLVDVLQQLNQMHLGNIKFQELPLSIIMEDHKLGKDINIFFAYQRGIARDFSLNKLEAKLYPIYNQKSKFDLFLAINQLSGRELEVAFEFERNILSLAFVQSLEAYYLKTLSMTADYLYDNPKIAISELISKINNYRKIMLSGDLHKNEDKNMVDLFKKSVIKNPNDVAIFDDKYKLSYRDLDLVSDQVAKQLIYACKNRPNKLVGMYFKRDINLPIYLLGVLKAGFTYIPLNEEFPKQRIEYIKNLTDPAIILTNMDNQEYVHIDDFTQSYENNIAEVILPEPKNLNAKLAYIMFTSGTTGQPKGVGLSHRALANRIVWMKDRYKLSKSDVMFMKTPFNFDVSFGEIFLPLVSGAQLFVSSYDGHKDIQYIMDKIIEYKVTHIYFVPTMLNIFLQFVQSIDEYKNYDFSNVKMIYCSGEALNQAIVDDCYKVFSKAKVYNQYGPTEAGEVSDYLCKPNDLYQIVPIGNPINNTDFIIVNKNHHPVVQGMPGELIIVGDCLADGYYNQELLTKQKFMYLPMINKIGYKTGDLVIYDQYNKLCFLERMDNQTKINGVRIELGEIEQALINHNNITQAFVSIYREANISDRLIAFYVTRDQAIISKDDLRDFLLNYLPQYTLPTDYFYLESIPTNTNGKIDKAKCLEMFKSSIEHGEFDYKQYSENEIKLIQIWAKVLNRDVSTVQIEDNFLLSGGTSLLVSKLILELQRQLNFKLNMFDIINQPTLENLLSLYKHGAKADDSLVKVLKADLEKYSNFEVSKNLIDYGLDVRNILVTGASGLIGRNTVIKLIETYPNAKLICLQRGKIESSNPNVINLSGDLEKDNFGISIKEFEDLAKTVDVIVHIGAVVNHLFGYNDHRIANVVATSRLIQLALLHKKKKMVFISTMGTSAHDVAKTDLAELANISNYGGYLLSKMIAEKIIYQACNNYGLIISILRLGYVGPELKNYDINYSNNHLYALFKSFYYKQCAPINLGDFECLPVNTIVNKIVEMVANTKFVIVKAANSQVITWHDVYKLFEQASGLSLQLIDRKQWVDKIVNGADPIKEAYLYKLISLYSSDSENKPKFELVGEIMAKESYLEIIKAYIGAISRFG